VKAEICLMKAVPISGADPGFVVRGGVSRRGVWGPRPHWVQGRALVGGPGGDAPPPEVLEVCGITDIYLNDNQRRSCIYAVTPWRAHRQLKNNWEITFKTKQENYCYFSSVIKSI
jgi:hypothetical protein